MLRTVEAFLARGLAKAAAAYARRALPMASGASFLELQASIEHRVRGHRVGLWLLCPVCVQLSGGSMFRST
jgi:hypothetical protein